MAESREEQYGRRARETSRGVDDIETLGSIVELDVADEHVDRRQQRERVGEGPTGAGKIESRSVPDRVRERGHDRGMVIDYADADSSAHRG
jgi:hypothetical protein